MKQTLSWNSAEFIANGSKSKTLTIAGKKMYVKVRRVESNFILCQPFLATDLVYIQRTA